MRPAQAVEHLQHVFAIRGGTGSDGILAVEVLELPSTATTHHLEPVRPAEPFAGLPDQSPVPLADAIGRGLHRAGDAAEGAKSAFGRGLLTVMSWILAFVPHRRPEYPRSIPRTAEREQGRRRRVGLAGMVVVAAASWPSARPSPRLPAARPTDAIPRATIARDSIAEAVELLAAVEERVDGADLVDRDPERARRAPRRRRTRPWSAPPGSAWPRRSSSRCGGGSSAGWTRCTWSPASIPARRSSTWPRRSRTSTPPTWSPPATARCGSSTPGAAA